MKLNKIAAAIALVGAAASANAAIDNDTFFNAYPGDNELFLTVWDTANTQSYVLDLGVTMDQFTTSGFSTVDILTAAGNDSTVAGGGDLVSLSAMLSSGSMWGVFAGSNGAFSTRAMFTMDGDAQGLVDSISVKNDVQAPYANGIESKATSFNGGAGTTDFSENIGHISDANEASYAGSLFGNNFNGQVAFSTMASIDESIQMVDLGWETNLPLVDESRSQVLGSWTLSANGQLSYSTGPSSEVPVPAAVWLLASGLLGLVGVSRRRKAA